MRGTTAGDSGGWLDSRAAGTNSDDEKSRAEEEEAEGSRAADNSTGEDGRVISSGDGGARSALRCHVDCTGEGKGVQWLGKEEAELGDSSSPSQLASSK